MQVRAQDETAIECHEMLSGARTPPFCPTSKAARNAEKGAVIDGTQERYVMSHRNPISLISYTVEIKSS